MRNLIAAGLLAGVAAASPLYAEDTSAEVAAAPDTPAAEAAAYDAATVLAVVNGTEITLGHLILMLGELPPQYQDLPDDVLLPGLLDQLVDQTLLAQARSASPETDPMAVRLQLENERRVALAGREADERFGGPVDAAEVKAAYDASVAAFTPEPEFNASHILVDSEERAKELSEELGGGADFAALAKENSADGSAAAGGELGWFGLGRMVPEFEKAVQALEVGEVSGPVESQFGWHLIRLNETRESSAPALEDMRPQIENQLRQEKLQAALKELRSAATIELPDPELPPAAIREADLLQE
jgi:peptidyl-prolyl cis-trans isomerase C